MVKVAVVTLGCKVNQCESAGIAEEAAARGMTVVPFEEAADCYIVNTCTVTAKTDYQSRQLIRRAIRKNPAAAVFVTGCYAQRAPAEIAAIPGVRIVAGNSEKEMLPALLAKLVAEERQPVRVSDVRTDAVFTRLGTTSFPEHTRAFLKVQDGCNSRCTYCIVPQVRGRSRSLPPAELLSTVATLADSGYREVVLAGIHLGTYGGDLTPPAELAAIIRRITGECRIERLRLSSIEPREVSDELLALMASSTAVCRHLHIPLQSGDDGILAAMHRNYDARFFRGLVQRIIAAVPGAAVGIDVMAGFPGETETAFANTLRLVEEMPLAYLHVFPYSRRPGTAAAAMPGQIPEEEKKLRAERLRRIGTEKRRSFATRFIGTPLMVLTEGRTDKTTGFRLGFSDNYIPVALRNPAGINCIVRVVPEVYRNGRLIAEVTDE